jgi:hypothetical protein
MAVLIKPRRSSFSRGNSDIRSRNCSFLAGTKSIRRSGPRSKSRGPAKTGTVVCWSRALPHCAERSFQSAGCRSDVTLSANGADPCNASPGGAQTAGTRCDGSSHACASVREFQTVFSRFQSPAPRVTTDSRFHEAIPPNCEFLAKKNEMMWRSELRFLSSVIFLSRLTYACSQGFCRNFSMDHSPGCTNAALMYTKNSLQRSGFGF